MGRDEDSRDRIDTNRRTVLKTAGVAGAGLTGLGAFSGTTAAAIGDVIGSVSLPNSSSGVGLTFTGQYVMVVDGFGSNEIDIYEPPAGGSGAATHVATKTTSNSISGIEWDSTRGMVWATFNGDPFWLIDLGDPTTSGSVAGMSSEFSAPSNARGWPADGLAHDANDDTLWWSPDNSVDPSDGNRKVWKFQPDGTLVREIVPKVNAAGDQFPHISGVAIGAEKDGRPTLYLGSNPGPANGNIVRVYADGSAEWISNFATGTDFRVEDIICDPINYAPREAILVKDSNLGLYRAFEVEVGTCPLPGAEIEVEIDIKPCSDPNAINPKAKGVIPVGIKHTDSFDPNDPDSGVDVGSLRFGAPDVVESGGGATPAHNGHVEDVVPCEGDGMDDLVVHFPVEDAGFDGDEDTGRLEGETTDGTPLFGEDSVKIAGRGGGGGPP